MICLIDARARVFSKIDLRSRLSSLRIKETDVKDRFRRDQFIIVFIDDILVYSKSDEEHEDHLMVALETLRKNESDAKFDKCEFWLREVEVCGGLFLDNAPLSKLTRKNQNLNGPRSAGVVSRSEEALTTAPILDIAFVMMGTLCTRMPPEGFRCVLMQGEKVIAYASRRLKPYEMNYPIHNLSWVL
ncbi:hypothetical protein K2173_014438 [Erythroxylum novogranatense]|uniref:Reverse transcriptase domain-containing protein n=1 Tax=Erythroxylum novogranatense TaxID=1862640 RepID=A0AAV8S5V9_9ROSI|nr:hypothetical protein K2173_014438 [Erythroxylum novogranatense]